MKKINNSIIWGLACSILVTVFGASLVYVLRYQPQNLSVADYIADVTESSIKQSAILSLSLLANIPLIYFNQKRKRYKTIAGIAIIIGICCVLIIKAKYSLL